MTGADYYNDLLRAVFDGKKAIIAVDVLVAAGAQAARLRDLGVEPLLAIAGTHGTGTTPDDVPYVLLAKDGAPTIVENIRAFEHALLHLPDEALAAIERADPKREAIVLGSFFTPPVDIAGRRVYGGRPSSWDALEDKVAIEAFFDAAGITRAPSRIIAARDVPRAGTNVVISGDAKEGFNGAAEYVRWIRTDDELDEAVAFFGKHCDEVRVMPFLEGIPCSIHGAVIGADVIALRPVEMITLRRPSSRFLYAGCATYWDPPDADRDYMRDVARRVGITLRDRHGYRGAFTVDGVLTEDGFRPTELNPRAGAGTGPLTNPSGVAFNFLNKAIIEGEDRDFRANDLEELLVTTADGQRAGGAYASLPGEPFEQATHNVVREHKSYRIAKEREDRDATITLGPSNLGRFALFAPDPAKVEVGPSFAPRAVEGFGFMDDAFGTGFGPLEPAKDLR